MSNPNHRRGAGRDQLEFVQRSPLTVLEFEARRMAEQRSELRPIRMLHPSALVLKKKAAWKVRVAESAAALTVLQASRPLKPPGR